MNNRLLIMADVRVQINDRIIDDSKLLSLYDLEKNHPNVDDFSMCGYVMDSLYECDIDNSDMNLFIDDLVAAINNISSIDMELYTKLFNLKVYKYNRSIKEFEYLYENISKFSQRDLKVKIVSYLLDLCIKENNIENIKKYSNDLRNLSK